MATKTGQPLKMIIALTSFVMNVISELSYKQVFEVKDPFALVRTWWEKFYLDRFEVVTDFSEVLIPPMPSEGEWRLIFILKGLTMNKTLAVMRTLFEAWVYSEDLDGTVTVNTRTSAQTYAIWVRIGEEPDQKYMGKSTRDADMLGKIGMTLLERMIREVAYFLETRSHLDIKGITFCTGSRDSSGHVPCMHCYPYYGLVGVSSSSVDNSNSTNGLREAVSL